MIKRRYIFIKNGEVPEDNTPHWLTYWPEQWNNLEHLEVRLEWSSWTVNKCKDGQGLANQRLTKLYLREFKEVVKRIEDINRALDFYRYYYRGLIGCIYFRLNRLHNGPIY